MKNLTLLITLLPFFGVAQSIDTDHQLLWEISGNGAKTSYLFGTMHTNDKRVFNLSDSTYYALNQSQVISCEVDIFSAFEDRDSRTEQVEFKFDRDGKPYTSSKESTPTAYGDEDGMPQPIDAFFQQYCHNAGKSFVPLETVEFQENIFTDVDYSINWKGFGLHNLLMSEESLLHSYLRGDITQMDEMMKQSLNMIPDLYDKLIVERNIGMANKLDSLIKNKIVFCAVGAGHLGGGAGMISLLKSKGYKLRQVVASYSENPTDSEKDVKEFRSYLYDNDTLGFHAIFPGKPILISNTMDAEGQTNLLYRDLGQGNSYEIEVFERTEDLSLESLAEIHIASPSESSFEKITLDNGGEAYQGLGSTFWDGEHWVRVIMSEEIFIVIKASGGNKFMSSPRAFRFFDKVWID